MEQRGKPVKRILRRNNAEQPAQQDTEHKKNVVAAYIHLAFMRHPLLLGIICGYLLITLTRLILGF